MIATLSQTPNKLTKDNLKEHYLYASELIKNTKEDFKKMRFMVERNFNVLGGRQGVVLGRDSKDNLITLNNVKTESDLRHALGYLSDYISNADTRTATLADHRANEIYAALEYLQDTLPEYRRMMVLRVACTKFVKSVRGIQKGELELTSAITKIVQSFSPDTVEKLSEKEKHKVEDVLVSSIRGFEKELNNWDKDMDAYISELYQFADVYVVDGRVSKGLKNRVKAIHDLADQRENLQLQIKECEKDLKEYDEHLKASGFKIRDCF